MQPFVRTLTWASFLSLSLFLFPSTTTTHAHNITKILAKFPDFSTFNHYLTITNLAPEINRRETITVCVVNNAGMADLLSKHLSIISIKNVLSLHILLDYFGAKKLHQITNGNALAATVFQATGSASGSSGFVNITDHKGGKVSFGVVDSDVNLEAYFVKSIKELPYIISVIQISKILPSPEAEEALTPDPSQIDLTATMTEKGCKVFADLLTESGALTTYQDNVDSGLTVFCPLDEMMKKFMTKYKNLTADGKTSLLSYHGVPVYESMEMLRLNNGLMNTLATDGSKKEYDFIVQNDGESVTLQTKIVTAKITGTLIDKQPLVIYTINKVLMPKELFKKSLEPTPAPAPEPKEVANSPSKGGKASSAPEPFSPDGEPAEDDDVADNNGGYRSNGRGLILLLFCVSVAATL